MKLDVKDYNSTTNKRIELVKTLLPKIPRAKPEHQRLILNDVRPFATRITEKEMTRQISEGILPYATLVDPGDAFDGKSNFLSQSITIFSDRWVFAYGQVASADIVHASDGYLLKFNQVEFKRSYYSALDDKAFFELMIIFLKLGLSGQLVMSITVGDKGLSPGSLLCLNDNEGLPLVLQAAWYDKKVLTGVSVEEYKNYSYEALKSVEINKLNLGQFYKKRIDTKTPLKKVDAEMVDYRVNHSTKQRLLYRFSFAALAIFFGSQVGRIYYEDEGWFLAVVLLLFAALILYGLVGLGKMFFTLLWPVIAGLISMVVVTGLPAILYFSFVDADNAKNDTMTLVVLLSALLAGVIGFIVTYIKLGKRAEDKITRDLQL